MGHANVVTTLTICTHLFRKDDTDVVRRLQAARAVSRSASPDNVIPFHSLRSI